MDFKCDECGKSFTRKYRLKVHKLYKHADANTLKRKHADADDEDFYTSLKKTIPDDRNLSEAESGFTKEESLQRHKGEPFTTVSKRNLLNRQASTSIAESFKFKHPFGMLVAGPTQSGKTQWTVKFLKERNQRINPPVDDILFCYSEWHDKYDTLRREVPTTQFHKGIPALDTLKSLQNVILVIDDLMEEAVNDQNIMNMFTVGSHHRNISVLFLMQNIFQKGTHARTISTNTQYMVLFKNARDQTQIRTLAIQIFPTNWNDFLAYYGKETNKDYGCVVLDFHPQTPNDKRIIKFHQTEETVSSDENVSEQQKPYEKSEQNQQQNVMETEKQKQPIVESKDIFENKKEEHELSVVKDFLSKHQQILNVMQQSLSDLKQTTIENKIEANNLVRDFQNKQQQDLDLIHKSILHLKQSAADNRFESDDMASDYQTKHQQELETIKKSLFDLKRNATSSRIESDTQDKKSKKRKKKLVRDNVPDDWNAPL